MDEKKIARAEHKYARISPRKVEIICDMIRGKDAKVALALMENTPKAGCELMIKVLKSAKPTLRTTSRWTLRSSTSARATPEPAPSSREACPGPGAVCTASTSAPATSPSPWLRETEGRRQNYGTES